MDFDLVWQTILIFIIGTIILKVSGRRSISQMTFFANRSYVSYWDASYSAGHWKGTLDYFYGSGSIDIEFNPRGIYTIEI